MVKNISFKDLPEEHQWEVASQLGPEVAKRTKWSLEDIDVEGAYEEVLIKITEGPEEEKLEALIPVIEASRKIRPILIDEVTGLWMEGIHRLAAAKALGLDSIPAYIRVK